MEQIVINGNNLDLLKNYPDNYFDAVVTDPPYGLGKEPDATELMKDWIEKGYHEISGSGFMGKEWDAFVPQPVFWKEVFRVLKHGGHVVAFYGTRTYDWGVMAMRFAGFEVRDCIQWIYGSGFPKSHNISKAIDKMPKAKSRILEFSELLKQKRKEIGLSISEADDLICNGSTMYNFIEGRNINGILKIYPPNKEHYEKIKMHFNIEGWDDVVENNLQVVGLEEGNFGFQADGERWTEKREIKESTTEQAKAWDGWGSALKPANEPIVLARKPLEKGLSIAENVLKWGTGGINIDGCRIGIDKNDPNHRNTKPSKSADTSMFNIGGINYGQNAQGRFPANLILTHHPECECKGLKKVKAISGGSGESTMKSGMGKNGIYGKYSHDKLGDNAGGLGDENGEETVEDWDCHPDCPIKIMDEQSGINESKRAKRGNGIGNGFHGSKAEYDTERGHSDSGGASRFFYCAKASKSERNKGLEGFDKKQSVGGGGGIGNYLDDVNSASGKYGSEKAPNKNFHPTVKPVKLMQYLVRMITPPNGKVLDPFCGSGTTGIACKIEGFEFVGMEQDPEYTKIAEARINNWQEEKEGKTQNKPNSQDNTSVTQTSLF